MEQEAIDKVEERLQQLEKRGRELRMTSLAGAVGVVVLCIFALFRILSGSAPQEIRAKQITVLYENGKPGILLAIRENNPRFSFRDIKGDLRAVFELQGEGRPVLTFLDKARHYRATFGRGTHFGTMITGCGRISSSPAVWNRRWDCSAGKARRDRVPSSSYRTRTVRS
jgi:hypothetical protein